MDAELFEEAAFYRAVAGCGGRVLLIGRRAVIAWGIPVITVDYDLWTLADDAALLNRSVESLDMVPSREPEEARKVGRYVLENGERVDVRVARSLPTVDGERVAFDDVWARREMREVSSSPSASARARRTPKTFASCAR